MRFALLSIFEAGFVRLTLSEVVGATSRLQSLPGSTGAQAGTDMVGPTGLPFNVTARVMPEHPAPVSQNSCRSRALWSGQLGCRVLVGQKGTQVQQTDR